MKALLAALTLACAAGAAHAEVQNYDCKLHSMEARGWIPGRVLVSVDADAKQARVYDGAIRSSNELANVPDETPAKAKLKVTRKGEYRMSWRINLMASSSGQLRVAYTATIDPKTNAFKMLASFPQANTLNRPSGVGSCKVVSSPNLF
ncbi:hypothetical protein [Ruegeria arenilitoris]|uniref:hypothetical protein n=1 Tax=Ruegeria arenilitoris TaxID=1173585 RepID=UPI00147E6C18|nr:hypothetical protein [Ruegeria arenilitoris]